jgi:hypothetical protein
VARACERCRDELVDDVAGFSHDGRILCTRHRCQFVEEMSRQIDEGTFELVDPSQFAVSPAAAAAMLKRLLRGDGEITINKYIVDDVIEIVPPPCGDE